MIFYYVRHADPIYDPDSITEHGKDQSYALADRLYDAKINKIFTSSLNRAIMTAKPACEKLGLNYTPLDWASENYACQEFGIIVDGKWNWCFMDNSILSAFNSAEVIVLGDKWYKHKLFAKYNFKDGIKRIQNETDNFFLKLGYRHDRENRQYIVEKSNSDRIAFVAHGGFGMAFLSSILDMPYNLFCLRFEQLGTSCVTVINFSETNGFVLPKIIVHNDYSHLSKSGIYPYHHIDF